MKYSPNLKYNILVSESCGLAQSLPYRLPCGFPAQIKSAGAGELRALAMERPVDGLILSIEIPVCAIHEPPDTGRPVLPPDLQSVLHT